MSRTVHANGSSGREWLRRGHRHHLSIDIYTDINTDINTDASRSLYAKCALQAHEPHTDRKRTDSGEAEGFYGIDPLGVENLKRVQPITIRNAAGGSLNKTAGRKS